MRTAWCSPFGFGRGSPSRTQLCCPSRRVRAKQTRSGTQTGINMAAQTDALHVHNVGLRGCEEPFIDAAAANLRAGKPVLGEAGSKAVPPPGPAVAMRRVAVTVDASAMTVGLGPKRPV